MVKNGLLNRLQEQLRRRARGSPSSARASSRQIVAQAVGARTRGDWGQDPATRTFQALRIFVNARAVRGERWRCPRIVPLLRAGGRLAVISFHSLEDRIVKRFFARASQPFGGDAAAARLSIRSAELPGGAARAGRPRDQAVRRGGRAQSARAQRDAARRASAPRIRCRPTGRAASRRTRRDARQPRAARRAGRLRAVARDVAAPGAAALRRARARAGARRARYDIEYGQLQLEQSTWGMPARVEKIAREQLKMQLPTAARTEIVALPARAETPR